MLFGKKKIKSKSGKSQPHFYDGTAEHIDFISPSFLRETIPNDIGKKGAKVTNYAVEVGGTITPVRYFRSFFAEISSGHTWAGMLDSLIVGSFGNGDIDLALHIRPTSNEQELKEIGRRVAGLLSDIDDEKDIRKIDAMQDEIADLKERQKRIRLNIERTFRIAIQVIVSANEWGDLVSMCRSVVQSFAGKSIYLRSADGQQLKALQSVLPTAQTNQLIKEHFLSLESSNLADMFPFNHGSLNHKSGVIIGRDYLGRPVWLDNWHSDLVNYHMCVIGRSGAGKSFTVMLIVLRSAHIGRQVGIIDWKGEYADFLSAIGCPNIELFDRSKDRINPYDVDVAELSDGTHFIDIEEASNSVQAVVFKMISVYDRNALTGEVKVFIGNAIRQQYADLGITDDPESLYEKHVQQTDRFTTERKRKDMPTLGGLYDRMKNADSENIKKAADMLQPFTKQGNMPSYAIFDGQSTVKLKNSPVFGFAINKLDSEIMRPIGLFVTQRWMLERWAKKNPMRQKIIIIEECQNIFNDEDVGGVWAESVFREARSTNTGVVPVTQGLEVFTRTQAGIAAIKNTPIKIIGVQEPLDINSVQGQLALTEGEADFLINKARKGQFVIKVDNQSVIVNVDASPFEHMLFTSDPNDPQYAERKEFIRQQNTI